MDKAIAMTIEEFVSELDGAGEHFDWRLEVEIRRGTERRAKPRFQLRASCKEISEGSVFEPIGAVCYVRTGRVCTPDQWADAAQAIGLTLEAGEMLLAAANDRTWSTKNGKRVPDKELQSLRSRLIETVIR